jgi:hypothetical protein
MNKIQDLIEKTINPPGILKKNRRALFLTIRDIAGIVRKDALTAFNAHFPYLADSKKLREHGEALLIPRLLHDSETEYRERVAAASFFLMKAGERQYIKGQLAAHFGDRFVTRESFLEIYLKVLDLTDDEISWAEDFLDMIVDPNVGLNFGKWKKLTDKSLIKDNWNIHINNKNIDTVVLGSVTAIQLKLLFVDEIGTVIRYDGKYQYDGTITYRQNPGFYDVVRVTPVPRNIDRMYRDDAAIITLKLLFKDYFNRDIKYDGKYTYDGSIQYDGGQPITDTVSVTTDYTEKAREREKIADQVKSGIRAGPIAETAGIKSIAAIKVRKSTLYDGEISYDGSHDYSGYTTEEVL